MSGKLELLELEIASLKRLISISKEPKQRRFLENCLTAKEVIRDIAYKQ